MCWWRLCDCRWQCMQPCMGCLWQFQINRFVLWSYWHCPVVRFPWQQQGSQSEHGRCFGNLGGLPKVDWMRWWAQLGVVAEFDNATATGAFAWVLLVRVLNTHIYKLDTKLYPSIPTWSLTCIQAANLPGYYETRTNTTIHITNSHNFSNVLSTMRVFLDYLVQQTWA